MLTTIRAIRTSNNKEEDDDEEEGKTQHCYFPPNHPQQWQGSGRGQGINTEGTNDGKDNKDSNKDNNKNQCLSIKKQTLAHGVTIGVSTVQN